MKYEFVAPCYFGTEKSAAFDFKRLGAENITVTDGRVAFTEEQVKAETARCLGCGASVVDPNKCIGCGICTTRCAFDAIHLHRDLPECSTMRSSEDKMKGILPYMIKRKIRIRRAKKAEKRNG